MHHSEKIRTRFQFCPLVLVAHWDGALLPETTPRTTSDTQKVVDIEAVAVAGCIKHNASNSDDGE